jgi:hypothetical protein
VITYVTVAGVFLITGLAAVAVPAYKAATIDPVLSRHQRA